LFNVRLRSIALSLLLIIMMAGCGRNDGEQAADSRISGKIESGLRVLNIEAAARDQHFTIYRGDYVRVVPVGADTLNIVIADLEVDKSFPVDTGAKPYFKVPDTGRFAFTTTDGGGGVIEAIDLAASSYHEVKSDEAAQLIANLKPVIVDVRTPREFQGGHLAGAKLIPVQEFQRRVSELAPHKNDPVFVYCRTGNRSTVAAKILVDQGFTNVINLRHGIVEWQRSGHEVAR
jgi:rhodanese-related sulfurtransferase